MDNRIFLPSKILQPFVQSFVITESLDEGSYRVLPDTNVVMGFQFKGKLFHVDQNKQLPLSSFGVTGLRNSFRIFRNSADIGTVLVFFKEGAAAEFFREPIHELFGESVSLDNFMLRSELLLFEEQLCEAFTDLERIEVVENFLLSRIQHREPDPLVATALAIIHRYHGDIRISALANQLHISQSPLEKRFRSIVGTSPKKFASIVRFRYALEKFQPGSDLTSLAYEAGFYDQAHFTKAFKNFTGESPEQFFRQK